MSDSAKAISLSVVATLATILALVVGVGIAYGNLSNSVNNNKDDINEFRKDFRRFEDKIDSMNETLVRIASEKSE